MLGLKITLAFATPVLAEVHGSIDAAVPPHAGAFDGLEGKMNDQENLERQQENHEAGSFLDGNAKGFGEDFEEGQYGDEDYYNGPDLQSIFASADADGDSKLNKEELSVAMRGLFELDLPDEELDAMLQMGVSEPAVPEEGATPEEVEGAKPAVLGLDFESFADIVDRIAQSQEQMHLTPEMEAQLREFIQTTYDPENTGSITKEQLIPLVTEELGLAHMPEMQELLDSEAQTVSIDELVNKIFIAAENAGPYYDDEEYLGEGEFPSEEFSGEELPSDEFPSEEFFGEEQFGEQAAPTGDQPVMQEL